MKNTRPTVSVVIVTFNRLNKLQHALDCFDNQTQDFDNLIIVDNCSTDGTKEFLEQWLLKQSRYKKHLVSLDHNTGGSGGFYEGEKKALTLSTDWVYVSDDDAYPDPTMMEKFYAFASQRTEEKISAIASVVLFPDGTINAGHRGTYHIDNNHFSFTPANEYDRPYFEINCISYVGVFLSSNALRHSGLVNKDFFIYQDDFEHSIRLNKYGGMYCISEMSVIHDVLPDVPYTPKTIWKEYYAYRNCAYMLLKHFPKVGRKYIYYELKDIHAHKDASLSPIQRMKLEGIKDAILGKSGIHKVYKPGLDCSNYITLPYPKLTWKFVYFMLKFTK